MPFQVTAPLIFLTPAQNILNQQDTMLTNSSLECSSLTITLQKEAEVNQKDTSNLIQTKQLDLSQIDSILRRSDGAGKAEIEQERQQRQFRQYNLYTVRERLIQQKLMYKQFGIAGFPIQRKSWIRDAVSAKLSYTLYTTVVKPSRKYKFKHSVFIEEAIVDIKHVEY
jgi:hypothetical protein